MTKEYEFQKGNELWKARSSHGRKPKFATPELLWNVCVEYFEWVNENPINSVELISYQGTSKLENVPKMRAMTITGMCVFIDISFQAWKEYRERDGYSEVCEKVDTIIREQKFTGAAAGLLNGCIIARDLGLRENVSNEHTGKDGAALEINAWVIQPVKAIDRSEEN